MNTTPTRPGQAVRDHQGRIGITISGVRNTGNVETMFAGDDYTDFVPAADLTVTAISESVKATT